MRKSAYGGRNGRVRRGGKVIGGGREVTGGWRVDAVEGAAKVERRRACSSTRRLKRRRVTRERAKGTMNIII